MEGLPPEDRLLEEVTIELITPAERERSYLLMESEHYLHNANAVGQVLRYVARYRDQWVALLTFCSALFTSSSETASSTGPLVTFPSVAISSLRTAVFSSCHPRANGPTWPPVS